MKGKAFQSSQITVNALGLTRIKLDARALKEKAARKAAEAAAGGINAGGGGKANNKK